MLNFDTFERDQLFLISKMKLWKYVGDLDKINLGLNVGKKVKGAASDWKMDDYLDRLDPKAMKGLCELYEMDFKLFGFHHEKCKFESLKA